MGLQILPSVKPSLALTLLFCYCLLDISTLMTLRHFILHTDKFGFITVSRKHTHSPDFSQCHSTQPIDGALLIFEWMNELIVLPSSKPSKIKILESFFFYFPRVHPFTHHIEGFSPQRIPPTTLILLRIHSYPLSLLPKQWPLLTVSLVFLSSVI